MSVSTRSEFVDFIVPLHDRLKLYDRTKSSTEQAKNDATDPAKAIPRGFLDAMSVREEVFVKEQKVPLENELDEDDERSFHWVAYASIPSKVASPEIRALNGEADNKRRVSSSTSTKIPIGTIRLVPPPHPPHPTPGSHHKIDALEEGKPKDTLHDGNEAYIKLGRLAVIREFRKAGISKLLIETALNFAKEHSAEIMPHFDPTLFEALRQESDRGAGMDWKGLVLVHAQTGVQKVWKKYGFETDESMGVWDEEGIDHVGMWRRLDLTAARRRSKGIHVGSPPSHA